MSEEVKCLHANGIHVEHLGCLLCFRPLQSSELRTIIRMPNSIYPAKVITIYSTHIVILSYIYEYIFENKYTGLHKNP